MTRGLRKAATFLLLTCVAFTCGSSYSKAEGRFQGKIITEWLEEGGHRLMKVYQSFTYVDSNGRRWTVPDGVKVDGASIPPALWSIIGSPFEGEYRDASVVHDYFCDKRSRKWQDVHNMFYDAMITRGVRKSKAWIMHKAVMEFGPRWPEPEIDPKCLGKDGKFDFSKCTENSGLIPSSVSTQPKITRERLLEFAKRVEGEAEAADVEALRRAADRL